MTRRILVTLTFLTLAAGLSAGLLHAQGSGEAERAPYRIDLYSGWNLISFPGDPVDTALESVIGDAQVDMVLGYQDDAWLTAVRNPDGEWEGWLETMTGEWGYWVHTPVEETIETALSPATANPSSLHRPGWNLVSIWDEQQRTPGEEIDADRYFGHSCWRVAYTWSPTAGQWTTVMPQESGTVDTGAGYWVWMELGHGHTPNSVFYFCSKG